MDSLTAKDAMCSLPIFHFEKGLILITNGLQMINSSDSRHHQSIQFLIKCRQFGTVVAKQCQIKRQ